MTRWSTAQVDAAIVTASVSDADDYDAILADEVRALRLDLAECRRNYDVASKAHEAAELRIVELRAELRDANRKLQYHSCGGGPTPCGGCCACLEAQRGKHDDTIARVDEALDEARAAAERGQPGAAALVTLLKEILRGEP